MNINEQDYDDYSIEQNNKQKSMDKKKSER